jgi:hypothetical protein
MVYQNLHTRVLRPLQARVKSRGLNVFMATMMFYEIRKELTVVLVVGYRTQ